MDCRIARPDRSAGFEHPRIADCQLDPEIRTKGMDVRRIVVEREQHDAGSVNFCNGGHKPRASYLPAPAADSSFAGVLVLEALEEELGRALRLAGVAP